MSRERHVLGAVLASSTAVVAYTYAGYPALAGLRAVVRPRPHRSGAVDAAVSVIIAAHNEAPVIADKLRTVAAAVPEGALVEVIVVDDGSTDGTAAAAAAADPDVRVLQLPRSGKAAALNAGVDAATGDILVFTDANSMLRPESLAALLGPFADEGVGGVAGDQRYVADEGSLAERVHWSFDRTLKRWESRSGSTVSATGALYAVRRAHFERVPEGVTDDFYISTGVVLHGSRLVFAADAICVERPAASAGREYSRKLRVMTRGWRAIEQRRELLAPRRGFYACSLWSRKVLRRASAVPIVLAAASSVARPRRSPASSVVAAATWTILSLGCVGWFGPARVARSPVFSVPAFACLSVTAALRALWNLATGVQITRWDVPAASDGGR